MTNYLAPRQPAVRNTAYKMQTPFPDLPPEAATRPCDRCVWVWKGNRMTLKFLDRGCLIHGRLLEPS